MNTNKSTLSTLSRVFFHQPVCQLTLDIVSLDRRRATVVVATCNRPTYVSSSLGQPHDLSIPLVALTVHRYMFLSFKPHFSEHMELFLLEQCTDVYSLNLNFSSSFLLFPIFQAKSTSTMHIPPVTRTAFNVNSKNNEVTVEVSFYSADR